jgi:hypothetical protein
MNIKSNLVKTLTNGRTTNTVTDAVKSGMISKSHGIITLFQTGMSVTEIQKCMTDAGVKVIYNQVYNTVSKKFPKTDCENFKTGGNNIDFFSDTDTPTETKKAKRTKKDTEV